MDAFALLSEPRRPWLDPAALQTRFLAQAAPLHPDRVATAPEAEQQAANARYAELNAAYNTLREPRERLVHLLELERGSRPGDIQRIPPGTMDLFVEIGQACRDVDTYLTRKQATTSPMIRLQLLAEGLTWLERLQGLQRQVEQRRQALAAELADMNAAWESAPAPGDPGRPSALPLDRLEEIYRAMSYVARWTEQLQERLFGLAE